MYRFHVPELNDFAFGTGLGTSGPTNWVVVVFLVLPIITGIIVVVSVWRKLRERHRQQRQNATSSGGTANPNEPVKHVDAAEHQRLHDELRRVNERLNEVQQNLDQVSRNQVNRDHPNP